MFRLGLLDASRSQAVDLIIELLEVLNLLESTRIGREERPENLSNSLIGSPTRFDPALLNILDSKAILRNEFVDSTRITLNIVNNLGKPYQDQEENDRQHGKGQFDDQSSSWSPSV